MAKKENTIPTIIDTPEALTAKIAAMKEAQKGRKSAGHSETGAASKVACRRLAVSGILPIFAFR